MFANTSYMMLPLHIGEDRAKDNLGKVSKKMKC